MQTVRLSFAVIKSDEGYRVRLTRDGAEPVEAAFQADVSEGTRLAGVVARIENDTCSDDDLRDLGSELWSGLTVDEVGQCVAEARDQANCYFQICLKLPLELEGLPWETLYDAEKNIFLATEPDYCVLRDPTDHNGPLPEGDARAGEIKLLAVIPEGSNLGVEQEFQNIKRSVRLVDNLQLLDLRGRVTPDSITQRLKEDRPDIFHFVGHGELDSSGSVRIRLNSEEGGQQEFWATRTQIPLMFPNQAVRLALFNCCYGGHSARSSLGGLGPLLLRQRHRR